MPQIMVVDDEELVRFTLRQALEKGGFDVVEAPNGKEALELQRREPADLVVTDILMPEKEGIETIRELKREYPDTKIIAISGGGRMDNVDFLNMSRHFGTDAVLPKPFDPRDLLKLAQQFLGS